MVLWARLGARLGALEECAEPLVARLRGARHRGPRILTQHSRNCFASMGDVKFSPQVSFVIGSFQYTKHSDACPMRVPAGQQLVTEDNLTMTRIGMIRPFLEEGSNPYLRI